MQKGNSEGSVTQTQTATGGWYLGNRQKQKTAVFANYLAEILKPNDVESDTRLEKF